MNTAASAPFLPPELLAPAGDWDCVAAATENGADAIYFGLDCGFNARHRAKNFGLSDLPELMVTLRQRGVRGYVTINTLAFSKELPRLIQVLESVAEAGADAVLVQDYGVAKIAQAICPQLEIHASTQMSLTSVETIAVARDLGVSRVVLARELSLKEIRKIAAKADVPLEVFIHGALCVAYSGQCLTSESLGGRSANRGQCAQACRLPYDLICDGETRDLGEVRYLLSPQDLAGYAAIPDLVSSGVASLKIEGRLKTAEYVANITSHYRRAIDEAVASSRVTMNRDDVRQMELSFSRGFAPGWLLGNNHKRLVPGQQSAKRGVRLGEVTAVRGGRFKLRLAAPIRRGDGLAVCAADGSGETGDRIYSIELDGSDVGEAGVGACCWIGVSRDGIDWDRVTVGSTVFKNDDPQLNRRLRKSFVGKPRRRRRLDIHVEAIAGRPLRLFGKLTCGTAVTVCSDELLERARKHPVTEEVLREKLGRLGGTIFTLAELSAVIDGAPMVPLGMLNHLRRDLVTRLKQLSGTAPARAVDAAAGVELCTEADACSDHRSAFVAGSLSVSRIAADKSDRPSDRADAAPRVAVLCRTLEQIEAAGEAGADLIYADFHDIRRYRDSVAMTRSAGIPVGLASVRIQKPNEMGLVRTLLRHEPDVVLARNLAVIPAVVREKVSVVADFSLNVANHVSASWIRSLGADRVTASYDLNREQLAELADSVSQTDLEVVLHQHMPMFHMEHCVFCATLSPGTDKTNCGRPCDRHVVQLKDRVGAEHLLQADVACRNTLFNATPQSGAEIAADLRRRGVSWFRIELLDQDQAETLRTIDLYKKLLRDELSGDSVWRSLRAVNRLGVTRGTLESSRNPLAIL